ncbi:MAG: hypothetical protein J1E98_08685 [Lachnospiraceae bacterium]|nr:hypothetical protein [Lachnospiraceae bacterium]
MIEHRGNFTKNELKFIEYLDKCFLDLFFAEGSVEKTEEYIRYDVCVGSPDNRGLLTLQFCVRDNEDLAAGFSNFVHISYIYVPHKYRKRGVATRIIYLMSYVATKEIGIDLYATCLTNDLWKERLISAGSVADDDGDIQIFYEPFLNHFQDKLKYPNYLK